MGKGYMRKVLIACQYATNKGDRAIAEYLLYQLKLQQNVQITLSTSNPELWDNVKKDGVKVIGMGYFDLSRKMKPGILKKVVGRLTTLAYRNIVFPNLLKDKKKYRLCEFISRSFIREVRDADLVIVTGGHHITSIRSTNALFDVTYDIGLISLFSKHYVLWSQTIGPLNFSSPSAKSFFGRILRGASDVYIRDDNSRICLQKLYPELTNVKKSFDSVFGFGMLETIPYEKRDKKVGISIFNGLKKAFDTYDSIARILDHYANKGYEVEFFRMEHHGNEAKDIQLIIDKMKCKTNITVFPFKTSTLEHLKEMASCRYYIGYKTHSVIMALTTSTPLIGICYHQKTRDFMADYGLEQYAIDDEKLSPELGIECAEAIEENGEKIHNIMCSRSSYIASVISKDLEDLLTEGGATLAAE